jgi:hypothetical protein
MHGKHIGVAVVAFLSLGAAARAGLHYSGEVMAELPSQWRGFLLDQRTLRGIGARPTPALPAGPARQRYEEAATRLQRQARERPLTADERADLGALHLRLGEVDPALAVLRAAQRDHPDHFRTVANLGTAWQLQGDLAQAAHCLQDAVRLAPPKLRPGEEFHLKLVRLRHDQPRDATGLDDLFGVRYVGDDGPYTPGQLAKAERLKLPPEAVAVTQQLALWLPADGRLLWQLAELANAGGDVRTAAAVMDGCVTEFGLRDPELRRHRQALRAVAGDAPAVGTADVKAAHEGHGNLFKVRSRRPLLTRLDQQPLPRVQADGLNALPWTVLGETTLDRRYRPTFANYLQELEGKQVVLSGFMQPLGEGAELAAFMLVEYPVGCWFCEMPDMTGIVMVELPAGKAASYTRGLVKVVGALKLNASDPENFLYAVVGAEVGAAD